mmetsp:Transcript_14347/g.16280  ORF Transcript_14347/g.16280 Transcript_14347/m.16280 type:complete len:99 (+) Transcript_14347:434-730(+)
MNESLPFALTKLGAADRTTKCTLIRVILQSHLLIVVLLLSHCYLFISFSVPFLLLPAVPSSAFLVQAPGTLGKFKRNKGCCKRLEEAGKVKVLAGLIE